MAYKNRGNVSTLKGVLVNPTDIGLQAQWYLPIMYLKMGSLTQTCTYKNN